jgi:hypothetical protein
MGRFVLKSHVSLGSLGYGLPVLAHCSERESGGTSGRQPQKVVVLVDSAGRGEAAECWGSGPECWAMR